LKYKEKNRYEEILLTNVKYCPKLYVNLLSMPAALKKGFSVGNIEEKIFLQKGNFKLIFDKILKIGGNHVCGKRLIPSLNKIFKQKKKLKEMEGNFMHLSIEEDLINFKDKKSKFPVVANLAISPGREIDIKQLYEALGHCNERTAVETAKFY